jgi:pilus assembly protein CpaC
MVTRRSSDPLPSGVAFIKLPAPERHDERRIGRSINAALQLDQRDSWLHFLNGFIYHLQARQGDSQKNELALEGYRTALRVDPGNWIAQEFLGLAYPDLKQFKQAKEQFAQALLLAPHTTVSMYGLMVTSCLTGIREWPARWQTSTDSTHHDSTRRSSARAFPSMRHAEIFDAAEQMRGELRAVNADPVSM